MKKNLIALAALCAMTTTASATEVVLWGIAEAAGRKTTGLDERSQPSDRGRWALVSGVKNVSRWGMHISEDLGGGNRALAEFESGINLDVGAYANAKTFDRAAYMGLQGSWGRLTLGRQTNLLADTLGWVDPLGLRFAAFNPNIQYTGLSAHGLGFDYGSGGSANSSYRLDNSVKYSLERGPLRARAMISLGETGKGWDGGSAGALLAYESDTIDVAGAFTQLRNPAGNKANVGTLGAGYTLGTWRFSANGSLNKADRTDTMRTRQRLLGVGVQKNVTPQFDIITSFFKLDRERTGVADDGFKRFMAFGEYKLSKRTILFVEGDVTWWDGGMQGTGNKKRGTGLSLGVSHRF
jgi:predicted porin